MKQPQKTPVGKAIALKTQAEVLADVQRLEQAGSFQKLHGYLIELAKSGYQSAQYESLFRTYLYSPEAALREAAVFCLLVVLQIQNPEYRAQALRMTLDEAADFDSRMWAGSGLAVAYKNTRDPELLAAFLAIMDDEASDRHLKVSAVRNVALLVGVSSRGQWLRAQSDSLSVLQEEFAAELTTARTLVRNR